MKRSFYTCFSSYIDIDKAFADFDKDGNGSISAKELKEAMKACGPGFCHSDKEVEDMLKSVDKNSEYIIGTVYSLFAHDVQT